MSEDRLSALSVPEYENILSVTRNIFEYLPDAALQELMGGYEGDIDRFTYDMMSNVHEVVNQDKLNNNYNFDYLEAFNQHFEEQLRISNYNYFKATCLPEFYLDAKSIEWGNLMQLYKLLCIISSRGIGKSFEFSLAYILWQMYGYRKPKWGTKQTVENANKKRGVLITNEFSLGKELLGKVREEIVNNEIIAPILRPERISQLGKESLDTKNGAKITLKSFGSTVRGLHPGYIVVDDFLSKSALYSNEANEKFLEVFNAEIRPALEPEGNLKVVGTPFVTNDLYGTLKQDKNFLVLEYPAVMPDGRLLSPQRLNLDRLKQERESLGSLVFSREFLVKPISDDAAIFPYKYLNTSKNTDLSYVANIDSFPIKLDRISIGCDFALSGSVGADSSVFSVWGAKYGVDKSKDKYYLIGIWKKKGASYNEQVSRIINMDTNYAPNKIIAESNGFQSIISDMVTDRGIRNIEPFTTTSNIKKDLYLGLPSLAVLFERGQIQAPYGDEESIKTTDWLLGEFNMIAFDLDKGKLEATSDHDDGVMSSFFAINDLRENRDIARFSMI